MRWCVGEAPTARPCQHDQPKAGYASVDALVALSLLAVTIALSMVALTTAKRAAATAVEHRQAAGLLRYLAITSPPVVGHTGGSSGGFGWTVTVAAVPSSAPKAPATCSVRVDLMNRQSRRRYDLSTLELCAAGRAA